SHSNIAGNVAISTILNGIKAGTHIYGNGISTANSSIGLSGHLILNGRFDSNSVAIASSNIDRSYSLDSSFDFVGVSNLSVISILSGLHSSDISSADLPNQTALNRLSCSPVVDNIDVVQTIDIVSPSSNSISHS